MPWIDAHLAVVAAILLSGLALAMLLQQRRTPQSMLAWILFIVLVPYIAFPVFLALGFRKRGSQFPPIAFAEVAGVALPDDQSGTARTFSSMGGPAATQGNAFTLIADGQAAYRAMLDLIDGAGQRLDIILYLIQPDATGRGFVQALERRQRDGIQVRLLIDGLGGFLKPRAALRSLAGAGGEVRYFTPFLHRPLRDHMNLRNHRKMIMADGARVFAGGRNVGADYGGPDGPGWIDLSYLLRGPAVSVFDQVFRADWADTGAAAPERRDPAVAGGDAVVQLVPSGPDTRGDPLHDGLVRAIHAANDRVWLTTPYFVPTEFLSQALATAGRRGVDVKIIVPRRSNHRLTDMARGSYLRELNRAGCRVLFHETGMLHAKSGVIDAVAWVGSANFDVRSMLLNFETALFVYDTASVAALADWTDRIAQSCTEGVPRASPLQRIRDGVFRIGAPML